MLQTQQGRFQNKIADPYILLIDKKIMSIGNIRGIIGNLQKTQIDHAAITSLSKRKFPLQAVFHLSPG